MASTRETTTKEDLEHLRNWASTQHHLPEISDKQLELFLHSCKFSLEFTKATIEAYFTVRTSTPEFFEKRGFQFPELQQIKSVIQLVPLPKRCLNGNKIFMGRLTDTEPSHFFLNAAIKFLFMVVDATQEAEGPFPGIVMVYDMQGVAFGHMTRINLMTVKKYFVYVQEAMPVRMKAIHVINVNPVATHVMNLVKPFLSAERLKKIHLHAGVPAEFLQHIPQALLPSDYNGDQPSLLALQHNTLKMLEDFEDWFKEDEKLRVDESKRDKNSRISFGIEGSFKKLDID